MTTQTSHFRKTIPAFAAALGMTAVLGIIALAFGVNALFNHNTVPLKTTTPNDPPAAASGQASLQQLQALVQQYQSRETQYQSQLQQAANQINQLTQQNQQYQDLINFLQQVGVIQVGNDGRVYINRNAGSGEGGNGF